MGLFKKVQKYRRMLFMTYIANVVVVAMGVGAAVHYFNTDIKPLLVLKIYF